MAEPIRKFDISWLPKVLPKRTYSAEVTGSGAVAQGSGAVAAGARGVAVGRDVTSRESLAKEKAAKLLQALRAHKGQAYVVELARDTSLDFQTTLSTILELTAAGDVKIVERDRHAADHLVALSDG